MYRDEMFRTVILDKKKTFQLTFWRWTTFLITELKYEI